MVRDAGEWNATGHRMFSILLYLSQSEWLDFRHDRSRAVEAMGKGSTRRDWRVSGRTRHEIGTPLLTVSKRTVRVTAPEVWPLHPLAQLIHEPRCDSDGPLSCRVGQPVPLSLMFSFSFDRGQREGVSEERIGL